MGSGGEDGDGRSWGGCGGSIEGNTELPTCEDPEPLSGGFVKCSGGEWLHRPTREACPIRYPFPNDGGAGGAGGAWASGGNGGTDGAYDPLLQECATDADCTAKPYGRCAESPGLDATYCFYGCRIDADCAENEICVCGPDHGVCSRARCVTDADCEPGALCVGLAMAPGSGCFPSGFQPHEFACRRPEDECFRNADCGAGGSGDEEMYCSLGENGRVCEPVPVCGRPFLVEGHARTAAPCLTSDWALPQHPTRDELPRSLRRELAAHYTELGLMEHASIAAFARFMLQLLALGAPAHLVEATERALADETVHARLCFGLASAYAGHDVGPGRLAMDGVFGESHDGPTAWLDVVRCAFAEACIGETLAVADADAALDAARDPAVREALARIRADEGRHAELGFRFVRWALETASPEHRALALRELSDVLERELSRELVQAAPDTKHSAARLAAHGVLPASVRAAARRAALFEIVLPCARALGVTPERCAA